MRERVLVVFAAAFCLVNNPCAGRETSAPQGLTAWRAARGIMLSWSLTPAAGVALWRGADRESLELVAILPGGQAAFHDLGAGKREGYLYSLGSKRSPDPEREVAIPALAGKARVVAGLVTTCSGLSRGAPFPADTRNHFFLSRDLHVQYYGYFFVRGALAVPRIARVVWRDPSGAVFSRQEIKVKPKPVSIPGGTVGQILLSHPVGLKRVIESSGQERVPSEPGLYAIEAFIDDDPVAVTVFYLKEGSDSSRRGR